MNKITPRVSAIQSLTLKPLPASRIEAAVEELAEALRLELKPCSAIERAAIEEFIHLECQRRRLRLIRDQIERNYALGQVWKMLVAAIGEADNRITIDPGVDFLAQQIVERWANGDAEAYAAICDYGIDIDKAIARGVAADLPQLIALERERENLAKRSRLLLEDIERARNFRLKGQLSEILDAEIVP